MIITDISISLIFSLRIKRVGFIRKNDLLEAVAHISQPTAVTNYAYKDVRF